MDFFFFLINIFELCFWTQLHYLGIVWSLQATCLLVGQDQNIAWPRAHYSRYWSREVLCTLPSNLCVRQEVFQSSRWGQALSLALCGPWSLLISSSFKWFFSVPRRVSSHAYAGHEGALCRSLVLCGWASLSSIFLCEF